MSAGNPGAPEPESRLLRQLQTAMTEAELAVARRLGMGSTDLAAMSRITFAGTPMGPGQLATHLGLTPGSVTELVDRLERAGHLDRVRDTADRRRVRLEPTSSAVAAVGAEVQPLLRSVGELARDFEEDERAVIRRFLERAVAAYTDFAHPEETGSRPTGSEDPQ